MKKEMIVELIRPARKDGGNRYETEDSLLVIYIPQHISRLKNTPFSQIRITFESV